MDADDPQDVWHGRAIDAAMQFARTCADLSKDVPYPCSGLEDVINTMMTELWDNGFSQSEIRNAFEKAIADMPRYAAGEEKRG